jgi:ATP-dependent DNA helicase PIF1
MASMTTPSVTASLSAEQEMALDLFLKGKNLMISGSGGSGKTFLIKEFLRHKPRSVLCAMTGCAAMLLETDSTTIHSWSGLYWSKDSMSDDEILDMILKRKNLERKWKTAEILIVDEVSMMSQRYFDLLDELGKTFRMNDKPFGGLQVVFVGDFFQLPPVSADKRTEFCFASKNWFTTFPKEQHVVLETLFRQSDPEYIQLLNEVRVGDISMKSVEMLQKYLNRPKAKNMTYLFPTRSTAGAFNSQQYSNLKEKEYVFKPEIKHDVITYSDGRLIDSALVRKCKLLTPAAREHEIQNLMKSNSLEPISLKKGAFVMCTRNMLNSKICNGSQGVITDFILGRPQVAFNNGLVVAIDMHEYQHPDFPCLVVKQYPICLAWAMTIHKIQGSTLDCAAIDIGQTVFEYGQTYVALSRVRSLEGLYLLNFNASKIRANPKVIAFYKSLKQAKSVKDNPVEATPETVLTEVKPEVKPEVKHAEVKPEVEPEVKPEMKPEVKPAVEPSAPTDIREFFGAVKPAPKPRKPRASIKPKVQDLLIYS